MMRAGNKNSHGVIAISFLLYQPVFGQCLIPWRSVGHRVASAGSEGLKITKEKRHQVVFGDCESGCAGSPAHPINDELNTSSNDWYF